MCFYKPTFDFDFKKSRYKQIAAKIELIVFCPSTSVFFRFHEFFDKSSVSWLRNARNNKQTDESITLLDARDDSEK